MKAAGLTGPETIELVDLPVPECPDYAVGDHPALAPDVHCLQCWYCSVGLCNLCDDMTMIGITPGFHGGLAEYCVLPAHALAGPGGRPAPS